MTGKTNLVTIKYLDILDRPHFRELDGKVHPWVASLTREQVSSVAFALKLFRNGVTPTPYTLLHVTFDGPEGSLVLTLDQEARQEEIASAESKGGARRAHIQAVAQ